MHGEMRDVLTGRSRDLDMTTGCSYMVRHMAPSRGVVASLVVVLLVAVTALAYASPPDPPYTSGLWDDGDYDDVVILATSTTSVLDVHTASGIRFVRVVMGVPARTTDPLICFREACVRLSRAPPTT